MLASSKTIKASFAPSSKQVFFKDNPHCSAIILPTYVLPVNFTALILRSCIRFNVC